MDLILHIGISRTATTALQRTLYMNKENISEHFLLFDKLGRPNNRLIANAFDSDFDDDDEKKKSNQNKLDGAFSQEMVNTSAKVAIISCEMLYGKLTRPSDVEKLFRLLRKYFKQITVVCWLRNKHDWFTSHTNMLEQHVYLSPEQDIGVFSDWVSDWVNAHKSMGYLDFESRLKIWENFANHLIVRDFGKSNNLTVGEYLNNDHARLSVPMVSANRSPSDLGLTSAYLLPKLYEFAGLDIKEARFVVNSYLRHIPGKRAGIVKALGKKGLNEFNTRIGTHYKGMKLVQKETFIIRKVSKTAIITLFFKLLRFTMWRKIQRNPVPQAKVLEKARSIFRFSFEPKT